MKIDYLGKTVELPDGSTARDYAEQLNLRGPDQAIAVVINGQAKDLSTALSDGDQVSFLSFEDPLGKEIFWHSSAHVLAQAVLRLWPDAKPTIGPAIESGFYYDFAHLTLSEEDFGKIEEEVEKILKENFRPERVVLANKKEALKAFSSNPFKCEIIETFRDGDLITAYRQGEFFDLCRGPHIASLGKIKAFKVLKTSGAYWRADAKNQMLTRLYGISFPDRKLLKEYLQFLEEAKKRDHKILGPKLDIFSIKEEAPGMPFIHAKGMVIWNRLIDFWRILQKEAGYIEIKTPQLMGQQLWETSGHWFHYKENMYSFEIEDRHYALKPMNCPGCMLYFKSTNHSYRDLPLRISEFGHVHRHEASGALNGLFRCRSFHQDDAHLFMRHQDIKREILKVLEMVDIIYNAFGLSYRLELSTRPEESIGSDEDWKLATDGLKGALDEWGEPYKINEGDGAFYGPKIDIHIRDALNRSWQCGTVQLDMALPEKFQLEYMDSDGLLKRPVMIHRALLGSMERFLGVLIEHFAGKMPLWISPRQVRIITVADRHAEYAHKLAKELESRNILCEVDDASESVNKKIRSAQLDQVNYMLTVGDVEQETAKISVRTRDNVQHGEWSLSDFVAKIEKEIQDRSLTSYFSKEGDYEKDSRQ